MRIKRVETLVKTILEENKETRNDDFILIAEVYYRLIPDVVHLPFTLVMLSHSDLKLPSLESITRARRKIQEKHEYLRASKKIQEIKKRQEQQYKEYARGNLN